MIKSARSHTHRNKSKNKNGGLPEAGERRTEKSWPKNTILVFKERSKFKRAIVHLSS